MEQTRQNSDLFKRDPAVKTLRRLSYDLLFLLIAWQAAYLLCGVIVQLRGAGGSDAGVDRFVFSGALLIMGALAFWMHRRLGKCLWEGALSPQGEKPININVI